MALNRQRVAELLAASAPDLNPEESRKIVMEMSEVDWHEFKQFLELVQADAVMGKGSWVRRDEFEHQVRCLDDAMNPTQSRSALTPEPDLSDVVARAVPVIQAGRVNIREVNLLRKVYEESRSFLRHNGIDDHRAGLALDRMDDAIEKVKQFDAGTDEEANPS